MANSARPLIFVLAITLGTLIGSSVASAQISFSDDFNDRTLTQERIGNNWTWFDTAYDAGCSTATGGFGPYSDGGGGACVSTDAALTPSQSHS